MGRFSKLETKKPQSDSPARGDGARPKAARSEENIGAVYGQAEEIPHDAAGFMNAGDEAFFSGETKQALRYYSRAMQIDAACIEAWIAQIRIMLLTDQIGEAKVWTTRALSTFPDAPALRALRSVHNAKKGFLREAMGGSDQLLSQHADDVTCWMARGHILLIADNRNADFCFQQCLIKSNSQDWRTPFLIGLILDSERRWTQSIAYYEAALERRTTLPFAWLRIARANANTGRREAARNALMRAEEVCGDHERLLRRIQRENPGSIFGRLTKYFRRGS